MPHFSTLAYVVNESPMKPLKNNLSALTCLFSGRSSNTAACIAITVCFLFSCQSTKSYEKVEQWGVFELELQGPEEGNPYLDVELHATFEDESGDTLRVPGFYDGAGMYRIRFSPPEQGIWSYVTVSNVENLSGKSGSISSIPPSGENHGPLEIINTFYFQYEDGSPFYGIGTTAYQWTSVKQGIQEKTLETLANSPFNKIRMCIFPRN